MQGKNKEKKRRRVGKETGRRRERRGRENKGKSGRKNERKCRISLSLERVTVSDALLSLGFRSCLCCDIDLELKNNQ